MRADPLLRDVMLDVAERALKFQADRDEALARRIINALAEALKRH